MQLKFCYNICSGGGWVGQSFYVRRLHRLFKSKSNFFTKIPTILNWFRVEIIFMLTRFSSWWWWWISSMLDLSKVFCTFHAGQITFLPYWVIWMPIVIVMWAKSLSLFSPLDWVFTSLSILFFSTLIWAESSKLICLFCNFWHFSGHF